MRTLDSIREEVAIREGFDSWDALIGAVTMAFVPVGVIDVLITDIATMYAEEAIEECAKSALVSFESNYGDDADIDVDYHSENGITKVHKYSILNIKQQLK